MAFRFRQFVVEDGRSSMRVGTDAILLGAWAEPGTAERILDIGTGCGVIALMLAQKSRAPVTAIDRDPGSVEQARENFGASPWSDRLTAQSSRLQDFNAAPFDLIVSNPPFFRQSLPSPDARRNTARHDDELCFGELLQGIDRLSAPAGRFAVIVPFSEQKNLTGIAIHHLFFLQRSLVIVPRPGKTPVRILLEFGRELPERSTERTLLLRDDAGRFTGEYLRLTEDYHLFPNEQQFD